MKRFLVLCLLLLAAVVHADDAREITAADLAALEWRGVGPCNMSGRVAAVALVPGSRTDLYLGYATGGLWKSTNMGTTWSPVKLDGKTSSIGAIGVVDAPADWPGWIADGDTVPAAERAEKGVGRVVWVGTGEGNGRNSSSWGNGVYRSTDGGGSFAHVGLADTHDIPRLAVDPGDPEVCWIAAMGHLWGPNPERGLYVTRNGGASWDRVLKGDDETGACDVVLHPSDPNTVYAALYKRQRRPWMFDGFSDRAGIYRSRDGGASWTRLTAGLPSRTGRIGLAVSPSHPDILYANVESDVGGIGRSAWDDHSPAGGLFRSDDGGDTWRRVNELNFRPFYFSRVAVDPQDPERVYLPGWDLTVSEDGGASLRRISKYVHVDHHAIVIDPADPERIWLGNDGGLYVSHDRGESWDQFDHLDVGQFYHVNVDDSDPYRLGGGLQDNGSWIGPSRSGDKVYGKASILNEDWRSVYGGDGFRVLFDREDPDLIYATAQGGHLGRVDLATGLVVPLRAAADEGQARLRWNWDAPFLISAHDPSVLYHGAQKVFKLTQRGDYYTAISGDLTRNEADKVHAEGSDAEAYGTLTALAESPVRAGVLWAGSDDGLVHVTGDDGGSWKDVTPKQAGGLYVSCLEPSRADADVCYLAVDGHRTDDFRALILRTDNAGGRWRDVTGDLPQGSPVRVVREDPLNPDVLYCGTEHAAYVTLDRGARWLPLGGDSLPVVPVYDLALQTRVHDLVAATHGRSLWILDGMDCLAGLPRVKEEGLHLFAVPAAQPRLYGSRGYGGGDRVFKGPNPDDGAVITYWLRDLPAADVSITIENAAGWKLKTLSGPSRPGLNRAAWNLQADDDYRFNDSRRNGPVFVEPGEYKVKLKAGELTAEGVVVVLPYPGWEPAEARAELPDVD